MRKVLLAGVWLLVLAGIGMAQTGVKKRRPLPYEYGRVTIGNFSPQAGIAPVEFDHWVHRSKFTCRLCHVDIGFTMRGGATKIRAADNMRGYYCGTCHNGKMTYAGQPVFAACDRDMSREAGKRCERCHVRTPQPQKTEEAFARFAENLPKERFGNGINWEKAEAQGLVKPIDFIEGVSVKRAPLVVQKDFAITARIEGMPDIVFSHKKHTVWNGCEVCHPELFVGVRKGSTKYSMVEIFDGKYCGACHTNVAFPLMDCQRCHTKPVQ